MLHIMKLYTLCFVLYPVAEQPSGAMQLPAGKELEFHLKPMLQTYKVFPSNALVQQRRIDGFRVSGSCERGCRDMTLRYAQVR